VYTNSLYVFVKLEVWKLNEGALIRTVWRTRFGRGYEPLVRHITKSLTYVWVWKHEKWRNSQCSGKSIF
jgi:hypothetical protein